MAKGGEHEMKKIQQLASGAIALLFPMMALAQAGVGSTFFTNIRSIINAIIGILFALVTLYFIWGVVKYVSAAGEEAKIKEGKQHMIWGIIGMAVMAGAWGLVQLVLGAAGVNPGQGPGTIPQF